MLAVIIAMMSSVIVNDDEPGQQKNK
jgi:hypothetical protein